MRPRGWRLDPAWVAHYNRLEVERWQRQMNLIRLDLEMQRSAQQTRIALERMGKCDPVTCVSLPGWGHEFIDGKCVFCGTLDAPQPSAYKP